jgi:hypothetical protein
MSAIRKAASAALTVFLAGVPAAFAQTGTHPGFTFTSLRPSGFEPPVSGLDFLPNGDLVVSTWEGFGNTKGSVYIVSNVRTGTAANITYKKFAGNLNEPLGVKVLDGAIHVVTRDQVLVLPDSNKDGVAETPRRIAGNWGNVNADPKILEFAFGLPYKAGKFFVGLATSWPLNTVQDARRGCILEVDAVTGAHTPYACGFRTPNGLAIGPGDELFMTENQGNWVPSSKLTHVGRGRFYGVKKTHPAGFPAGMTETPPSVWVPHGDVSVSPTQPIWMRTGTFKGQMVAGDNRLGTLQRYFLEKMGNEYQGAVFRLTGGLEAGASRIVAGPDGELYVGGIGAAASVWGGWNWNDKFFGLQRMAPTAQGAFELLAVRSKGPTSFEVEFTEPAAAGAGTNANWTVRQWTYIPKEAYGEGKQPNENLSVQGVTMSTDGLKATLNIPGLKTGHVVHIKLANVTSKTGGKALWAAEAWYTLNAFGPGTDVEVTPVALRPTDKAQTGPRVEILPGVAGQGVRFKVASSGAFKAELRDATGTLRQTLRGIGPMECQADARLAPGVYALSVRDALGSRTTAVRQGR